jgi:hypothetical protein
LCQIDHVQLKSSGSALVKRAAPLVDKLVRLTRLPGVKGVVGDIVDLVHALRAPASP